MKLCRKHTRRLCWRCLMFTAGFPIEHLLWEKVPGFVFLTHLLGV